MSRQLRRRDRRILFISSALLPLCLALSACGGGGTEQVASIPPPPPTATTTPTPTATVDITGSWFESPATQNGTYDVLGRLALTSANGGATAYRTISPGQLSMSTSWYFGRESGDLPWYSISGLAGILPAGLASMSLNGPFLSWSFGPPRSYADTPSGSYCCQLLGQRMIAGDFSYDFTHGTTTWQPSGLPTNNVLQISLDYDIGYSYVAMGEWNWNAINTADSGDLLFVDGARTPPLGIPVSGTATYDARTLRGSVKVPFALTADFGQRTISTSIAQDYLYTGVANAPTLGIHVAGSAPFSNDGIFDIPLIGSANYSATNAVTTPAAESVTGTMDGAFFGPNAENVGGTFGLNRADGTLMLQDAFVGQQHH